jgi:hypothetical protein
MNIGLIKNLHVLWTSLLFELCHKFLEVVHEDPLLFISQLKLVPVQQSGRAFEGV